MIALAALLVLGKTQGITLTVRARPIKEVCAILAERSGLKLSVKGKLQDEPVIVAVKDVPTGELMDKLAEVAHAEWSKDADGRFELARSAAMENEEYKAHLKERVEANRKSIRSAVTAGALSDALDDQRLGHLLRLRQEARKTNTQAAFENRLTAEAGLPARRALVALLQGLDEQAVASILPGESRVFSNFPTSMQFPLGGNEAEIRKKLWAERNQLIKVGQTIPGSLGGLSGFSNDPNAAQLAWNGAGLITLKVSYSDFGDSLTAILNVYDQAGKPIVRDTFGISAFVALDPVKLDPDPDVEWSPDSTRVLEAIRRGSSFGRQPAPPDKETSDLLADCVRHDPLSFGATDLLIQVAQSHGANLMAMPDDQMDTSLLFAGEGAKKASDVLRLAGQRSEWSFHDHWMFVTPRDRYLTRLQRIPRDAASEYLKARAKLGYDSLDHKLAFALATPYLPPMNFVQYHDRALGPAIQTFDGNRKAFRFYASLSEEQRKVLMDGGKLSPVQLLPEQKKALEDWAFRSTTEQLIQRMEGGGLMVASASLSEPTTGVGDGLARRFEITATVTKKPVAICYQSTGGYALDAMSLAINMARHYYVEEGDFEWPEPTGYRAGTNMQINLTVKFDPNLCILASLNGLDVDLSQDMGGLDVLPADFRAAYSKQLATQIENLKRAGAKPTGNTVPPP